MLTNNKFYLKCLQQILEKDQTEISIDNDFM